MLKNDRRSINNKYLRKQIILIVIIITYIVSLSLISARYVKNKITTYLASSKEFYFYSDKLSEKDDVYPIKWSGTEECVIPINLYTKMNSLKVADYDIAYKITLNGVSEEGEIQEGLPEGINCDLSKTEGIVEHRNEKNNTDAFVLSISNTKTLQQDEIFRVKVTVETEDITTDSGEILESYKKQLTRIFEIKVDSASNICKIEDKEGRAYLNFIANTNSNITLRIDDSELIFDNTNKDTNSWSDENNDGYIDKINVSKGATIKIFKKNTNNFYSTTEIIDEGNNIFRIKTKDVNQENG